MNDSVRDVGQLPLGRPRRYLELLDYEILRYLAEHSQAVGSGTLQIELRRRGYDVSAPTIGRKLRELEVDGHLNKVSVRGRTLTESGKLRLTELSHELSLTNSSNELNRLITEGTKVDILQLLEARRLLKREIIRLAVANATAKDLEHLARILQLQQEQVARGELGVAEDMRFHDTVAELGGNRVLRSMLSILRHEGRFTYIIASIRQRVGGPLAVDHVEILNAMKSRNVGRAQRAVDHHLRRLMHDVERYWQKAMTGRRRSRGGKQSGS